MHNIPRSSVDNRDANQASIFFDLDDTLVTFPKVLGEYSNVHPVYSNVKIVQELHAVCHTSLKKHGLAYENTL